MTFYFLFSGNSFKWTRVCHKNPKSCLTISKDQDFKLWQKCPPTGVNTVKF